jgi:beta-lactamase regulating signal transducer with metallopeptidase domain/beta-lactamase class D
MLTYTLLRELGLALLHFLWEGSVVAVLLAALLVLLRGKDARIRYALACNALALMLLLPAFTLWGMSGLRQDLESDETSITEGAQALPGKRADKAVLITDRLINASVEVKSAEQPGPLAARVEDLLPWLTLLWLAGILVLSSRMIGGLILTRRIAKHETYPVSEFWLEKLKKIAQELRVEKPVRLLRSSLVEVPTAIGWLRPVILLPACIFTGLTTQQLEAILAHELAHIRRHDYLVNLLQIVAETLLFYHPAVWWVSRRVRIEREHVCDDLAVSVCGDPIMYARALMKLERLRTSEPGLALAANGGELRTRISRLLERESDSRWPNSFAVALFFVAALFTTVLFTRAVLSQKQQVDGPTSKSQAVAAQVRASANTNNLPSPAQQTLTGEAASLIASDRTEGEDTFVRRVAIEALGNRAGSVVVMNPRTGRVYTVVNQEWAIRRGWIPASTMKLVTALAGIGEKVFDPAEKVRVSTRAERLNLTDALAISNNEYFRALGTRVGVEPLISYARRVGFGEQTGINYEGEHAGHVPGFQLRANAGRLGMSGEGIEVTPIQLATLVSAFANGGTLLVPRVPMTPEEAAQFEGQSRRRIDVPLAAVEQLIPGMLAAVERGTAVNARDTTLRIAGKTGTVSDGQSSIGMLASYAPVNDPQLVIVVLIRGRNENGAKAAQVAGAIYKGLNQRM